MSVESLIVKVSKFYWSPNHPSTYHLRHGEFTAGLGLIAHHDYAAFNIAYAAVGKLESLHEHLAATALWSLFTKHTDQQVGEATLGEWITLYQPPEFEVWYKNNREEVNSNAQRSIDKALRSLHRIRQI